MVDDAKQSTGQDDEMASKLLEELKAQGVDIEQLQADDGEDPYAKVQTSTPPAKEEQPKNEPEPELEPASQPIAETSSEQEAGTEVATETSDSEQTAQVEVSPADDQAKSKPTTPSADIQTDEPTDVVTTKEDVATSSSETSQPAKSVTKSPTLDMNAIAERVNQRLLHQQDYWTITIKKSNILIFVGIVLLLAWLYLFSSKS